MISPNSSAPSCYNTFPPRRFLIPKKATFFVTLFLLKSLEAHPVETDIPTESVK
jgi:hypothetical protein